MSSIDYESLRAAFHPQELEWRIQQAGSKNGRPWALCVPYVTNRAIQTRLDEVVGPANWQNHFRPGPDGGIVCGISIRDNGEWITKWDGAENTDIEGIKGGLSAAMKRAAVQWGIGRYLYALDDMFARIHDDGRFRAKYKDQESTSTPFRWDPPELPSWALPQPRRRPSGDHDAMLDFIREVGARCEDDLEIRIGAGVRNLKSYIRENWQAIKEQYRLARSVVDAIEAATGEPFRQAA